MKKYVIVNCGIYSFKKSLYCKDKSFKYFDVDDIKHSGDVKMFWSKRKAIKLAKSFGFYSVFEIIFKKDSIRPTFWRVFKS